MSVIFRESFDNVATNADLVAKGWVVAASITIPSAEAARTGPMGCFSGGSNGSLSKAAPTALKHATFIAGCFIKAMATATSNFQMRFYGDAGSTLHVRVDFQLDGGVSVYRNTTLLGSVSGVLSVTSGVYVEVRCVLHDTTGAVEVRLNGSATPVLNLTGIDTKNAGTASVLDTLYLAGASSSSAVGYYIDDVYLNNGAGTIHNTFEGDVAVDYLPVNGAGTTTQLTASSGANYTTVDETGAPVLTDYVESATDDQFDTYALTNLPAGAVPKGLQIVYYAAKTDVGAKSAAPMLRSGGTNYTGTDQALSTSGAYYIEVRELDPATSAAWTEAGINALEVGVKVRP